MVLLNFALPLFCWLIMMKMPNPYFAEKVYITVKILKVGTPQTIAIIVLKLVKFDVTLH